MLLQEDKQAKSCLKLSQKGVVNLSIQGIRLVVHSKYAFEHLCDLLFHEKARISLRACYFGNKNVIKVVRLRIGVER